jgi:hypothetical protein
VAKGLVQAQPLPFGSNITDEQTDKRKVSRLPLRTTTTAQNKRKREQNEFLPKDARAGVQWHCIQSFSREKRRKKRITTEDIIYYLVFVIFTSRRTQQRAG